MLHVRKRNRQKYSEACRPILGKHTDGWAGRIIDLLAVFALLAGTATTFSVATPLMATIISEMLHVAVSRTVINIIILLITCAVYTYSLLHGFKGISKLANICIYMFFGLIAFMLPFTFLLMWTAKEKLLKAKGRQICFISILWYSTKAAFLFSLTIEFLQLFLRLGTFQLSDLCYNTLGGAIGGVLYWMGWKVKK